MENRQKKIYYASSATFPSRKAHSIQIMKMCQAIVNNNLRLTLIANMMKPNEDIFRFYQIKNKFKIKKIKILSIRMVGRLFALLNALCILIKNKPDYIYTRDVYNCLAASLVSFFIKSKVIYEIHETPRFLLQKLVFCFIHLLSSLKLVIFISEVLNQYYIEKFKGICLKKTCLTLHDGVDLDDFANPLPKHQARNILGLNNDSYIAGYIGSLHKEKGIDLLIEVALININNTFLIVGGSADNIGQITKKIEALNLKNIIVIGQVPYRKVSIYMSACDVLLMPYQSVRHDTTTKITTESLSPLKMFEYMAASKPIIASHLPEIKEILEDQVNALLIDPENYGEWANALDEIRTNERLATNLAQNAKKCAEKYSWDMRAKKIISTINEIC